MVNSSELPPRETRENRFLKKKIHAIEINLQNNKFSSLVCLTLIAGALAIPANADVLVQFIANNLGQVNVSWSGSLDTITEPAEIGDFCFVAAGGLTLQRRIVEWNRIW